MQTASLFVELWVAQIINSVVCHWEHVVDVMENGFGKCHGLHCEFPGDNTEGISFMALGPNKSM